MVTEGRRDTGASRPSLCILGHRVLLLLSTWLNFQCLQTFQPFLASHCVLLLGGHILFSQGFDSLIYFNNPVMKVDPFQWWRDRQHVACPHSKLHSERKATHRRPVRVRCCWLLLWSSSWPVAPEDTGNIAIIQGLTRFSQSTQKLHADKLSAHGTRRVLRSEVPLQPQSCSVT